MKRSLRAPTAVNYRGERLSVGMGIVLAGVAVLALVVGATSHGRLLWVLMGVLAVFLAGLYDDTRPGRTRGMRAQVAAALGGRLTPGVVKLMVIVGASALVSWMLGARGGRFVAGAAVMAGCANLWNLLDVRPGRALKLFIPAAAALASTAGWPMVEVFAGLAAAAVIALVVDLQERGMLGDCGANVLGFMVGVGTFHVLPAGWLWVVLAALVALHVVADTITLSRIIVRTPPLRWFDELGRKKFATDR